LEKKLAFKFRFPADVEAFRLSYHDGPRGEILVLPGVVKTILPHLVVPTMDRKSATLLLLSKGQFIICRERVVGIAEGIPDGLRGLRADIRLFAEMEMILSTVYVQNNVSRNISFEIGLIQDAAPHLFALLSLA